MVFSKIRIIDMHACKIFQKMIILQYSSQVLKTTLLRGVNMFAMLVGKLPFKVKPFNLKKLYQKMVTGDIELLPAGISQGSSNNYHAFHCLKPN